MSMSMDVRQESGAAARQGPVPETRKGWARRALALLLLLGASLGAHAANNQCRMADSNSKGQHVPEICWLQLDGVLLDSNGSTPLTFDLPDGSTLQLTAVVANVSGGGLMATQAPSWGGSQFSGSTGFYTIYTPNQAVLYSPPSASNNTSVTLQDIRLFNPTGAEVFTPFELILADGESTNDSEYLDFGVVEGGSKLQLLEWLGDLSTNNLSYGTPAVIGGPTSACSAMLDCQRLKGKSGTANAAVFSTTRTKSPFSVIGQVHTSGGRQGFAFGLRWGGVKLNKVLTKGRLYPADQFTWSTVNVKGVQMDSRTSSGSATGSLAYATAQAVMPGNTVTLKEAMAPGSLATLAQYDKTISCSNAIGSTTPMPSGAYDEALPPTIDLRNKGDNIACSITNVPRLVDLAIAKTAPAKVTAGQAFDYTLTISNTGTHTATGATWTDTLPTGFPSLVAGDVSCGSETGGAICGPAAVTVSGTTAQGAIQSLPAGSSVQIVIHTKAPANRGAVSNTATVALATTDTTVGEPNTANNSSTANTQVIGPELQVAKTSDPSFTVGVPGTYTLTVTNNGDAATTADATVTDTLPSGLTPGAMPAGCTLNGAVVSCTVTAGLAATASRSWSIPVTPDATLAGTNVSNTASVSGGGDAGCPGQGRCSSTVTTPVKGAPQLELAKHHNGDFIPGVDGTYTLTVRNIGSEPTSGTITVSDTLPTGLTAKSATGSGWACTLGATVTCTSSAVIPAGGAAPDITLVVNVAASAVPSVTNTAKASGGGDNSCPAAGRCTASDPTTVNGTASFTLAKHASVADTNGNTVIGDAGDTITYTFEVTNTGTVDLTNVVVSDPKLPGLICTVPTLAVGATQSCAASNNTYVITAADVTAGKVTNTATAKATPPGNITPPTATSPEVDTPTAATPVASFTLAKHASVADTNGNTVTGDEGDTITYTFDVTNTGTVALTNVIVSDPKLPGLACTVPTLAVGATQTCAASSNTYVITAADVAAGKVTNTATAKATPPGTIPSPTATSPEVDTPTAATPVASFTLAKHATVADTNGNTVIGDEGDTITYTFEVTNTGTVALTNVVVSDPKLPGLACTVPTLAVGATQSCAASSNTYVITAADVTAGKVTNTATAKATPPGTIPSPTATSPEVDTPTAATPVASFTLAKHATVADTNGNTVIGDEGDTITYTFEVTNTGTVALTNVVVSDPKLPGLACTVPTLAVGATQSCAASNNTYVITAADVAAGKVVNTATAKATPPGTITPPTATSPQVETPTEATPVASFTLAKHASVADTNGNTVTGDAGDTITYTFDVTNTGTVALTNVVVSDPKLPGLVCTVPTLAVGATQTCAASNNTYVITAADVAAGKVVNTATATSTPPGTIPPTATTGTVTTPTVVSPIAGFTLRKSASVADTNGDTVSGDAGDVITYSFEVTNTGTVALTNVVVSDPKLPNLVCTVASLPVGATQSCAASGNGYTITAADESAQQVVNTASATATPPGTIPPPRADATVTTPVAATPAGQLRLSKQAGQPTAKIGDLVRYTIAIENTGVVAVHGGTLVDTLPTGFSYVDGSLTVEDEDRAGSIGGISPLRIKDLDIAAGGHATVSYFVRVGAGTGKGVHTNRVVAVDSSGRTISNQASADVELAGDPLLDDSLLLGTVFDDRNGDGWQASATARGVRVQGGFAPSAYVANSTTIDRGNGPQPLADHSAPLLHGVDVGRIGGRQSVADPVERQQVVIRQHLTAPAFTDDFVLTTADGSTLRMDAAGRTTVERKGDAARGLSAEDLEVERRLGQDAGGLVVDYVIRNRGIDERGIPGVRVASVDGLLMETDAWGRFHLVGVDGGAWTRGRNFILKVDPATLPPGSVFTTENPRVRRITPGVPVRFDFGVRLPPGEIGGGHEETTIELGELLFAPGSAEIAEQHQPLLDTIAGKVKAHDGGTLTITAQAEQEALALARAQAVRDALLSRLAPELAARTHVRVLTEAGAPLVDLDQATTLGSVLFDTDRDAIKPVYRALLAGIARQLDRRGGGTVAIVGRADRRGGSAYNVQLGLRRAKAVYAAIAADLSPEVRAKLRVEISDNPDAATGMGKR